VSFLTQSPAEALRSIKNQFNTVLNKVLTEYRLQLLLTGPRRTKAVLAFLDRHRQPRGVPLHGSSWYLSLKQEFQAIPEGQGYRLHVLQYAYRIQKTDSVEEEAEVRFEYVSPIAQPNFPYSRHHVQFHRDSRSASSEFSLSKLHIPTGGVTIEDVIRFLIADLGVSPLTERWKEELRESEKVTRDWLSDTQQD
jgi:hypothetical protein